MTVLKLRIGEEKVKTLDNVCGIHCLKFWLFLLQTINQLSFKTDNVLPYCRTGTFSFFFRSCSACTLSSWTVSVEGAEIAVKTTFFFASAHHMPSPGSAMHVGLASCSPAGSPLSWYRFWRNFLRLDYSTANIIWKNKPLKIQDCK